MDISVVGPGAYGVESELGPGSRDCVYMERMSTDMTALKMQYDKLRQRQRQAHIIIAGQLIVLSLLVGQLTGSLLLVASWHCRY